MTMREKIKNILSENYKSINGSFGQKYRKGHLYLNREDAKRKRKERDRGKRKDSNKLSKKDEDILDPKLIKKEKRKQLIGEMRLTPLETFASRLIIYLESNKSKHMSEIFNLMEDYPKLKSFVKDKSQKFLPNYEFKVYSARESLNEEIGQTGKRNPKGLHNWTLSKSMVTKVFKECENYYIMECKVNPEDVVIYLPAFSKLIERVILEGLVDEPMCNVIRECKVRQEIVLPAEKYNEGYIVEVAK